jgi:hypothetical protein
VRADIRAWSANRKEAETVPNQNLYIPAAEIPLWEAARRVARKRGTSLYRVVSEALQRDLPRADEDLTASPAEQWAHIAADAA